MSDIPEGDIKRQKRPSFLVDDGGRKIFNDLVAQGNTPPLQKQNLATLDLRGYNMANADLSDSYMHGVNLAGVDLRNANLSGASMRAANVSGCYFPKDLPADEIRMSLEYGTRIRHR
jgi:uncharacterized protein YjbI with pentapeptide repeats